MKYELKLVAEEPEDKRELEQALKAGQWPLAVSELYNFLRNEIKHGSDEVKATHYSEVRDQLTEILAEYELSPES